MRQSVIVLMLAAVLPVSACRSEEEAPATLELATKSTQGEVSFDLTPRATPDEGLVVSVQANTHSGDLAQLDLGTAMVLEAEGRSYEAVEATRLAGHHAAATVRFDLRPVPERFAVTISGVRSMPSQRLEWP